VNLLNGGFISIYKMAGFLMLGAIVFAMVAYLITAGFYIVSRSWVVPTVLSPSSERVMTAHFQYLGQLEQLHRQETDLASERRELELVRTHRERYATYADNLATSLKSEVKKFEMELGSIRKFLARNPSGTSKKTAVNVRRDLGQLQQQYSNQLISEEEYTKALLDASRLSKSQFDEGRFLVELKERAQALARIIAESVQPDGKTDLSHFVASVFATGDLQLIEKYQVYLSTANRQEELIAREEQIESRIKSLETGITQLRESLKRIEENPDVRAASRVIYTAFVPYENLKNVKVAGSVYGCYLHFLACTKVGRVKSQFASEALGRHPMSNRELRGQVIELEFMLPRWAESKILFVGRPPLFI
jgi:cell shape-determining protein MreC